MNRQSEQLFSKNCCAKALVVFIIDYSLCKELMHLITVFFFQVWQYNCRIQAGIQSKCGC